MRSREQNLVNLSMLIKVPVAGTTVEVIRQYIETQGEKSIEHSISFPDLSDRRTEDISWQNIWLLSFFV